MNTDQSQEPSLYGLDRALHDPDGTDQPRETLEQVLAEGKKHNLLLNPRQYQSQLFEKAKTQNVIACLGTGSGKTLISVLLLKHMFNKEVELLLSNPSHNAGRRRMSLFLVNKIPLVRQQAQVIVNNTFLRVTEVFGTESKSQDLLTEKTWQERFRSDKFDVIVATAQVVLDALTHAFIRMDEINLIVFDEAHHAHKQDSYARIMHHHYFTTPASKRPKIFGMTASPLKAVKDYGEAVAGLEKTLDAKIFTARSGLAKEIESITGIAEEHIIKYKRAKWLGEGNLTRKIKEQCSHLEELDKHLSRMAFNDLELGPLMSDLAWLGHTDEMKGRVHRKLEQAGALDADCNLLSTEWIQANAMERMRLNTSDETQLSKRTKYVQDAAVNSAISEVVKSYPPIPDTITVDSSNATSKILTLIGLLEKCGSTDTLRDIFCGIMFVKRQQTAIALCELLKRVPSLQGWLRPEWVTGHNHDYGQGMDPKMQAETLQRFGKSGSTNLLIATTVLEEGMDISPCNYVIRFDLFDHHVSYLQSKGRARHKNSLFIVLVEEDNMQHYDLITTVNKVDREIKACWRDLPEEQGAIASMDSGSGSDSDSHGEGHPDYQQVTLTSPTTGACLRPLDCVSIVCHYVGTLSRDQFSASKPEFFYIESEIDGYQVELRFPANAKIRTVLGPWCRSKKSAARMASFEACKQLFALKELDDHLLPRKVKKTHPAPSAVFKENSLIVHFHSVRRRSAAVYDKGIPRAEDVDGPLTLHGIIIQASAALVDEASRPIFTLFPSPIEALPPVELFMDIPRIIPATKNSVEVKLDAQQAKAACQYTYQMLCLLGRQEWKGNRLPYLVLPMAPVSTGSSDTASMIDWSEVSRPLQPMATRFKDVGLSLNNADLRDAVLCEGKDAFTERLCEFTTVRDDLNPNSLIQRRCQEKGKQAEDESYLFSLARKRNLREILSVPTDQPLLECVTVPRTGSKLDRMSKSRHTPRSIVLIPSLAYLVHCSASFLRSCMLLPSIMERYEQVFLVRELNRDLLGNCVDEQHLVEAMTLSCTEQSSNYERLEYDGDCFLKLLTTTWAFSKCDSHRESDLNVESKSVLSNAALLKITLSKKIAEYATGKRLKIKTWHPPLLQSDKQASAVGGESTMSSKTMADLVESILGAAWASSSDAMDLSKPSECATRLEILGPGVKADMQSFKAIFEGQVKPKEETGLWDKRVELGTLSRLQEEVGYTFISPHLALEAVTHSSMLASGLPSYDRLEFLGDAVLDLLVVSLFKSKYPHLDAGGATSIKGNAICNASLAVLCVDLGLYGFLMHSNKKMAEVISSFKTNLGAAKKKAQEVAEADGSSLGMYWTDLKPPKVLADVVEAMLGAVYVDSGFNIRAAKAFFDRMYKSHFDTYFHPETSIIRSPYDFVQLIKSHECTEWDIQAQRIGDNEDQEQRDVQCDLLFHGNVLTRQTSKASRAKTILRYLDDLESRRKELKEANLPSDGINGSGVKTILQACFQGNYVRDSQQVVDEQGTVVDLKVRNQYAHLHALCQCKRNRLQREEGEIEAEGEEEEVQQ